MIRLYLKDMEYQIRTRTNTWVYYLRKLPGLKKKSQYRFFGLKDFLIGISPIYGIIHQFFSSLLSFVFFGLVLYAVNLALEDMLGGFFSQPIKVRIVYNYLAISGVIASLFSLRGEADSLRTFRDYFHIDPSRLYRMKVFFQEPLDRLIQALTAGLALKLLGLNWYYGPVGVLLLTCLGFLADGLQCYLAEKKVLNLGSGKWVWEFILLLLVCLGLSFFIPLDLATFFFHPLQVLVVLGGLAGAAYLYRYKKIGLLLDQIPEEETTEAESIETQTAKEVSRLKEEDYTKAQTHIKKDLSGYKLLNELFFQRHRRLILKPILIKSGVLLAIFLGLLLLPPIFFPDKISQPMSGKDLGIILAGLLPLACYIAFFQENLTKIIFINCDQALLQYDFYRRPKDLLLMFRLRLNKLILWNSLPALVFLLGLVSILVRYGFGFKANLAYLFLPLILWIFFSLHTLFLYYYFQPYTNKYEAKSPIYHLIRTLVYMICWQLPRLSLGSKLALGLAAGALVYIGLALVLVYTQAPKRFRLKT